MSEKKPKHNLSSYAYEKEWDKVTILTDKEKKQKKFWR